MLLFDFSQLLYVDSEVGVSDCDNFKFTRISKERCFSFWVVAMILFSSSAIVILSWDYLMYCHDLLFRYLLATGFNEIALSSGYTGLNIPMFVVAFFFFPLFGLLADVWIGRYKAILIGMVLCFISWVMMGIGLIVCHFYTYKQLMWSFYMGSSLFQVSGYLIFRVIIIQYNIDQLVGASANELSTIIYWHSAAAVSVDLIFHLFRCFFDGNSYFLLAQFIASGFSITFVLVSYSLFKHKFENISLIKNPIKLIVRVLCYARKHKYPENRSALTYWEEEAPSRLDLGKGKYGGPFTEEEVEDVKIFLRILFPLIILLCAYDCIDDSPDWIYVIDNGSLISCMISTQFTFNLCTFFLVMVYVFVIRIFFSKYIPSMLSRMGVGLFFALTVVIVKVLLYSLLQGQSYKQYGIIASQ